MVAEENDEFIGWLRFNLFWDNTPFMNMLFVLEPHRGKGIGRQLVTCWEREMRQHGSGRKDKKSPSPVKTELGEKRKNGKPK